MIKLEIESVNEMKKILLTLLVVALFTCGFHSVYSQDEVLEDGSIYIPGYRYTQEPDNSLQLPSTDNSSDLFDAELGLDIRTKTFEEGFQHYIKDSNLDYEIVTVLDNVEYIGKQFKIYYLSNDVMIMTMLNSERNIAAFMTASDLSETDSLNVLMDIYKNAVYPYPEDWRDIYNIVIDLVADKEKCNYGPLSFYKYLTGKERTYYVFAPRNFRLW